MTAEQRESKQGFKLALKVLKAKIEAVSKCTEELHVMCEDTWDASLSAWGGGGFVNVDGPDCNVWAKCKFDKLVDDLIDNDNDILVKALPVWISAFEAAIPKLKDALEHAKREEEFERSVL